MEERELRACFVLAYLRNCWLIHDRIGPALLTLGLCFGALAISLLVAEGVMRLVRPQQLVRPYGTPDFELKTVHLGNQRFYDTLGLPMYAYHVRTNALGFRMDEEPDFSPDIRRILTLGDSFLFGWGVEAEHSFFRILADKIKQQTGSKVQLLNGGVGAYGTGHVYKALRKWYPVLRPFAVIYFFNSNDLEDNLNTNPDYQVTRFQEVNGTIKLEDKQVYSPGKRFLFRYTPWIWLNKHSHLFLAVKTLFRQKGSPPQMGGSLVAQDPNTEERMVKVSRAHVLRLVKLASSWKLPLLVIWIPAPEEIRQAEPAGFFRDFKNKLSADLLSYSSEQVSFCDPTVQMQRLWNSSPHPDIYFPEGHYNEQGNRWYAQATAPCIETWLYIEN
jgi:hypothetical protein